MSRLLVSTLALLLFAACGASPPPAPAHGSLDDEADEDRYIDEEEEGADTEEQRGDGRGGFVDEAILRGASTPLVLGEPVEVPGTGVTMRPPEGAQPIPFAAGFLSMEHRVQISVVVAIGPESLLDAVRGDRSQVRPQGEVETIQVAGQSGRVGRDRVQTPQGELERAWLLAHDGARGLAVVATYEASRAPRVWPAMREAFGSVEWDRDAELDPARALGIEVARVEGLTPNRSTTANVVLLGRGATYPPEPGQPVVTIAPLPVQLASEQSARVCEQLVARLLPVPTSDIEHEGAIEDGPLSGCERLATAEANGLRIATYAALVFASHTPILVTGSVEASQLARYRRRFSAAARAVRPRS